MACEPILLVMMMMAFLKDTVRPWLSVTRPSSRIWSSTLKTSACAFSTSSKRTTAYGRRLQKQTGVSCDVLGAVRFSDVLAAAQRRVVSAVSAVRRSLR